MESPLDLGAFHAGDAEAIRHVYLQYVADLLRDLRRQLGPAEAESVVHDVFVELLRNHDLRVRFTGGSLLAWLRQIARLKTFEHLRRVRRDVPAELPDIPSSPESELEARNVLMRFMAKVVPPKQREFFALRFLETLTQVEVAARMGMARSTLEGWEHALAEKLRAFILESAS